MTAFCASMRRTVSGAAERCVYPVGHACQHRHVLSDSPSFPRLPLPDEEMSTLATMPLDDQTARELSRAAANVRTWTEKRNTLIRAAFAAGGGVREIAKATGLNVGTVHTMLHGRKR